jgi:TolB-like protein
VPKVGYRFNCFDSTTGVGQAQPDNLITNNAPFNDLTPNKTTTVKPWWFVAGSTGALLMLIGVAIYLLQSLWQSPSQSASLKQATDNTSANKTNSINIAVQPFVNMSDDLKLQLFVDGLTEEMLNSLTAVPEFLVVSGAGSSAGSRSVDRETDLTQLASKLGVNYFVQGSVRKNGNKLRITVRLIDANSGAHLFSSHFDETFNNVLTIQRQIGEQVAAALKLSLVHKNLDYSTALAKLDHLGVEQLVIARAQLATNTEISIKQAFDGLQSLNQRFPDTAEVIGLLALVHPPPIKCH